MFEEAIAADNFCLEGAQRPETTIAFHFCRGNNQSKWYAEGGYEAIAERLFGSLTVDRFLLEYDTERAGTFEPLRFMPANKMVVLGLISSKDPALESPDYLLARIEEASGPRPCGKSGAQSAMRFRLHRRRKSSYRRATVAKAGTGGGNQ
jgi:5-methyltetrahydropteroyltriglutamate--homocysteine methyltransferase